MLFLMLDTGCQFLVVTATIMFKMFQQYCCNQFTQLLTYCVNCYRLVWPSWHCMLRMRPARVKILDVKELRQLV